MISSVISSSVWQGSGAAYRDGIQASAMRDNSDRMPELVRIVDRDGRPTGVVRISIAGESRTLELPLTPAARSGFLKILNLRPLDQMPGQPHRYFFARRAQRLKPGSDADAVVAVRVEVGRDVKNFEVTVPYEFAANLMWLSDLEDWSEVASFISKTADASVAR